MLIAGVTPTRTTEARNTGTMVTVDVVATDIAVGAARASSTHRGNDDIVTVFRPTRVLVTKTQQRLWVICRVGSYVLVFR